MPFIAITGVYKPTIVVLANHKIINRGKLVFQLLMYPIAKTGNPVRTNSFNRLKSNSGNSLIGRQKYIKTSGKRNPAN